MEPVKQYRHSECYNETKSGLTRTRSKSDLTINELESKKKGFINRFIQKVAEMETDFAAIRKRYLPPYEPVIVSNTNDVRIAQLKLKLEKLIHTKVFCAGELIEQLERIQTLSLTTYSRAEFRSVLAAQIEYINDSLTRGIMFYFHPGTKKASDLLDYVSRLALNPEGVEILVEDKKLLLQLSNAYIVSISKKLSLVYPRDDELETQFTELIQTITALHECKKEATVEEMRVLLNTLNKLNNDLQQLYEKSLHEIRMELFLTLKPDSNQELSVPDLNQFPLFMDIGLIDDPVKESRRMHLDKILTELGRTEEVFSKNVGLIAESPLFLALVKEQVITLDELSTLKFGWKKLHSSSVQLRAKIIHRTDSLLDKFDSFLRAFSPLFIDEQIECCKLVMINYMVCKKLIDKIELSSIGKQMMLAFSAANRLDLKDIWIMPVQRPPRYILLLKEMIRLLETDREKDVVAQRIDYLEKWVRAINYFAPDFSK